MNIEEVYKDVFAERSEGYAMLDSEFFITEPNRALQELTGYRYEELEGAGLNMLFDNFTADKIRSIHEYFGCRHIQQTISGGLLIRAGGTCPAQISINCSGSEENNQYWLLIKPEKQLFFNDDPYLFQEDQLLSS